MTSLVKHLGPAQQLALFDDLNYLNIAEFRGFCDRHGIPYTIHVQTTSGRQKKTRDTDRKAVVLDRIRHYLKTGAILPPTCFAASIVKLDCDPPEEFTASDRLYYGWYNKKNAALLAQLQQLTGGKFRDGAVARLLLRDLWTAGKAPTLRQFAKAWLNAEQQGLGEHPECAWLTDRARKTAGSNWKAKRKRIAQRTLKILEKIPPPADE